MLWLIRSPAGRLEIKRRYGNKLWPTARRFASLYRRSAGRRVRVIAVIGSVGKTTTMRAVSAALGQRVTRAALLNANARASTGRQLLGIPPWRKRVVLEIGIGFPGDMRIQAETVRPNVVVVTAIAEDHWESMGSIENTRNEKADMLRILPRDGIAIVNGDDENVRWMATQTKARVVYIGVREDAEIRATDIELDWPHGMRFVARVGGTSLPVTTKLVGRHMIFPALAAIAVAHIEGVPLNDAAAALAELTPTPGRMQTMALQGGAYALRDEFKGSEHTFRKAFEALAEIPASRRIAVIGEIAEEHGNQAYRDVGAGAAEVLDRVVFVGTSKKLRTFRAGATRAGLPAECIDHVHTWEEARDLVKGDLREGDVLFIKGRWQQALGRVGLALAGKDVQCHADPCPFKRMLCDVCPFLEKEFYGLPER